MKSAVGIAVGGALLAAGTASADVIAFEDFDGGAVNLSSTTNVFDFNAGGGALGDVFGRVSPWNGGLGTGMPFDVADDSVIDVSGGGAFPGDTRGLSGQNGTAFFAMNDMDAVAVNNAVWSFDISSAISITDITMDIGAMGDFEASSLDGFLIEAQIDGGGYTAIFQGIVDEAASKVYRLMDDGTVPSDTNDPLELFIDGAATGTFLDKSVAATGNFDSYTSLALAGQSGSNLDIRISWAGTPSGSEPMGMDNFTINGTIPAPGALALLGLAGVVARRRRRA
ncbi:MAG: hypothetical protein ACYSU7_07450 [Planctomycetota bacterium]|jgi:hypothetical protein